MDFSIRRRNSNRKWSYPIKFLYFFETPCSYPTYQWLSGLTIDLIALTNELPPSTYICLSYIATLDIYFEGGGLYIMYFQGGGFQKRRRWVSTTRGRGEFVNQVIFGQCFRNSISYSPTIIIIAGKPWGAPRVEGDPCPVCSSWDGQDLKSISWDGQD